jgi:hypothetical protein
MFKLIFFLLVVAVGFVFTSRCVFPVFKKTQRGVYIGIAIRTRWVNETPVLYMESHLLGRILTGKSNCLQLKAG